MIRRDQAGIAAAVAISIAVHASGAAYLINRVPTLAKQPMNIADSTLVDLTLVQVLTPDAAPKPAPTPALRPNAVPHPVQNPRPRPAEHHPALPEPIKTPEPEPDQLPVPQHVSKAAAVTASTSPTPAEKPESARAAAVETDKHYLAHLLEHIDEHKFYPRSARRRGLEGSIEVSFQLLEDGNIRDLRVTGGSRVLRTATEQAIQRALPMPAPHGSIKLQQRVNFDMEYRLEKTRDGALSISEKTRTTTAAGQSTTA